MTGLHAMSCFFYHFQWLTLLNVQKENSGGSSMLYDSFNHLIRNKLIRLKRQTENLLNASQASRNINFDLGSRPAPKQRPKVNDRNQMTRH